MSGKKRNAKKGILFKTNGIINHSEFHSPFNTLLYALMLIQCCNFYLNYWTSFHYVF